MKRILCWMLLLFSCSLAALAVDAPLNKVGTAAVTVTQYAADGKAVGKVVELTDGNAKSRWLCRAGESAIPLLPIRLAFDLGTARTVVKLRLANYFTGANFERGFKNVDIFVGDVALPAADAKPDATVLMTISDAIGPAWTEIALPKPLKARYVALRVKDNWGADGRYAANEVEIYTVEADPPVTTIPDDKPKDPTETPKPATETPKPPTGGIIVTQYDTTGKVVGTLTPLTDHDLVTRWNCDAQSKAEQMIPVRLCFDLGAAQTVTKVRIANYCSPSRQNANRGIKTVDVFVGDALAPVKEGTPAVAAAVIAMSDANGVVWTEIVLPKPMQGRFVTLRIKDNWGGTTFAANEVEIVTTAPNTTVKPEK